MKLFHISDVLSITTGRLVSTRHMEGVYDILNFLTGDTLYAHQLPRAWKEALPWMREQHPALFPENPRVQILLDDMARKLRASPGDAEAIRVFVDAVRHQARMPEVLKEMLPVFEMSADMHARIDPVRELEAMVGPEKVIVITPPEEMPMAP